jgi:hypothetical protein
MLEPKPETSDKGGDLIDQEDRWWEEDVDFEELVKNSRSVLHTPYGLQDANGVDLTLIEQALSLSPLERLRRMDRAARDIERIHRHVRS